MLPVLACGEIVMSADPPARIGRVADSGSAARPRPRRTAYWLMASGRFPPAVVRKMFDRDLVVVKVSAGGQRRPLSVDAKEAADDNPR